MTWRDELGPADCPACGRQMPTIHAVVGHLERVHHLHDIREESRIAWSLRVELTRGGSPR
jgi:hypothetical protein